MNVLQAFILGIVQGLGEFLPISSSGHLLLAETIMGIQSPGITMEVLMHLGTLAAVLAVYWDRFWYMAKHPVRSDLYLLVLATIPAVLAALLLGDFIDTLFGGAFLGIGFLITALLLWFSEWFFERRKGMPGQNVGLKSALIMGGMQALAIAPGISRSGSTIVGGLFGGVDRKRAADFSFMMSVPAILGSVVLDLKNLLSPEGWAAAGGAFPLVVGMVTAAVFGYLAIRGMLYIVRNLSLKVFSIYTGVIGILVVLDQFVLHIFFKA